MLWSYDWKEKWFVSLLSQSGGKITFGNKSKGEVTDVGKVEEISTEKVLVKGVRENNVCKVDFFFLSKGRHL